MRVITFLYARLRRRTARARFVEARDLGDRTLLARRALLARRLVPARLSLRLWAISRANLSRLSWSRG